MIPFRLASYVKIYLGKRRLELEKVNKDYIYNIVWN